MNIAERHFGALGAKKNSVCAQQLVSITLWNPMLWYQGLDLSREIVKVHEQSYPRPQPRHQLLEIPSDHVLAW